MPLHSCLVEDTEVDPTYFVLHEIASKRLSALAEALPGAFTYLGIYNESVGSVHGLHTPRFTLDESVLPRGAALHAAVAFEFFGQQRSGAKEEL